MPDLQHGHNPDVLSCLANLSSDEVFTPPEVVNAMLDMLPESIWNDPKVTFLDPACKSGVFLREIAKRLIKGLEHEFPDLQTRLNHIFHNQLFGIAITELTALLSRRSLYCSKWANGPFAISRFENADGNIRFARTEHCWKNGRCVYCGASQAEYDRGAELESHAYEFIHIQTPEKIFDMKFDVIIGNPPYQLNTAGDENGAQAKPLYHKFVEQAKKLNPHYLSMIIPSRWFTGGWGLDDFRKNMIFDNKLLEIHDFQNASDCFPGVDIKGGVCYFLWSRRHTGSCKFCSHDRDKIISISNRHLKEECCNIVIRYNDAINILNKIRAFNEITFDTCVSTKKPFGFTTNFKNSKNNNFDGAVKVYANKRIEYVPRLQIKRNIEHVDKYKVIVPKAVGSGNSKTDIIKPLICEPGACCTETYLLITGVDNIEMCKNMISYIGTKFFHFLVTLQKNTQDCMKKVYSFVPLQDFSKPWTDAELYAKYGLTEEEIAFIESMIKPMDVDK